MNAPVTAAHIRRPSTAEGRKSLVTLLRQAAYEHTLWDVYRDFIEASAIALSNRVDWGPFARREARYLDMVKRYRPQDWALFPRMLAAVIEALEADPWTDILGAVYMELDLGSKWHGQVFTPSALCEAIAAFTLDDRLEKQIRRRGFVTVHEPAVGGGAMLLALAKVMVGRGLNPQRQLHVVAQDLDEKAVHMAYVQLALCGIPAVVICGNTLTNEVRDRWHTPAHVMGLWTMKLRRTQ